MSIKGKRILITAGPTWVPIDKVRVISNIATGETGLILAKAAICAGSRVTLVMGPGVPINERFDDQLKIITYHFFNELRNILIDEIMSSKYDIVIHSAAVADYEPIKTFNKKIASDKNELSIRLRPTFKLVDIIKKLNSALCVVGFKFETESTKENLFTQADKLLKRAKIDFVVANTLNNNQYKAYLLEKANKPVGPLFSKQDLAATLLETISKRF
jgi:phosphopantothenoylcysteine decarboxylase/phosphopantothenate--cysteine ligase